MAAKSGGGGNTGGGSVGGEVESLEALIEKHVPEGRDRSEMQRILYGVPHETLDVPAAAAAAAAKHDFQVLSVRKPVEAESFRAPRIVRVGAIQNKIVAPTTAPLGEQWAALRDRLDVLIDAAAACGTQLLCLQEAWTMPFAFCTREKRPWLEFAEDARAGRSAQFIREKCRQHRMAIVSPILERDAAHGDTIHNTAVVFGPAGNYVGKHRKNHIPRVGDFNESTYYMEGNTGHPVFDLGALGKVAINICYGRHHPLNWLAFALNGAEVVFNPSATVGALSEPMWGIEQRNAAIANNYYVVAINRIGTESFPNEFTSGNGAPAHKDFGHFYGTSYVANPDGSRTPGLSRTRDGVLVSEVDLNLQQQVRDKWCFAMTARYSLYADTLAAYVRPDFCQQIIRDTGVDNDEVPPPPPGAASAAADAAAAGGARVSDRNLQ